MAAGTTVRAVGSVRRHVFVEAPAERVWELVGDPSRLHEWFPITDCRVEGTKRWITLASGLTFEEDIITLDHVLHRFQYRIVNNPIIVHHLGTVDVIPDDRHRCCVVYGTDVDPEVMALIIGGAAGAALERLQDIMNTGGR